MTVRGPVPADRLGVVAMHEHLVCDLFHVNRQPDFLMNDEATAGDELRRFKEAGGGTLVDLTTRDLRRDPAALRRISEAVDVHVVMGGGWYRQLTYPPSIDSRTVNDLADEMVRDVCEGADGSGIRSGILGEIGSDREYVSGQEERVFRAVGRAQRRTGVAVSTHTSFSPVGLQQLDILVEEGADPRRVVIGHCDTYLDRAYHQAILERGAYVQFDGVGRAANFPDARRLKALVELIERGHAERLLLSSDVCRRSDWHAYGGVGYDYCLREFVPLLKAADVPADVIQLLLVDNPRRVLAG
jgi:predicted metal-dependent phosphotriesterase family hydrolase